MKKFKFVNEFYASSYTDEVSMDASKNWQEIIGREQQRVWVWNFNSSLSRDF